MKTENKSSTEHIRDIDNKNFSGIGSMKTWMEWVQGKKKKQEKLESASED